MNRSLSRVLFVFVVMASLLSQADILFLDLNASPKEIEAAQKAAKLRGEELLVFPKTNKAELEARSQLGRRLTIVWSALHEKCANMNNKGCAELAAEAKSLRAQSNALVEEGTEFDSAKLELALKEIEKSGRRLSSVIVSGHSQGERVSGINGNLDAKDINTAFAKNSALSNSVRSVLLWGCYTATGPNINRNWKTTFPNINMIAGFDGRAPQDGMQANSSYISDLLVKEKQLTEQTDRKKLQDTLYSIANFKTVSSSVWFKCPDLFFGSKNRWKPMQLSEFEERCKAVAQNSVVAKTYTCYFEAHDECKDPPKNVGQSPLRTYYSEIQENCGNVGDEGIHIGIPNPKQMILLIDFRNVVGNISLRYDQQIAKYNEQLASVGLARFKLEGLNKMSRQEIIKNIRGARIALDEMINPKNKEKFSSFLQNPSSAKQILTARQSALFLEDGLINLNTSFKWANPPSLLNRGNSDIGTIGSDAQKTAIDQEFEAMRVKI